MDVEIGVKTCPSTINPVYYDNNFSKYISTEGGREEEESQRGEISQLKV